MSSTEAGSLPIVSAFATGFDNTSYDMEQMFPNVDPQFEPYGARVLVQVRRVITKSKGGIILSGADVQTEAWNMQVGKLIAAGPLAFKKRDTAEPWPEGVWANVGDYVRVPRWSGDRLSIDLKDDGNPVIVLILNDSDLLGKYTGDPREVRAYIQ